ncbi:hypothetical protein [Escherichia phage ZCEC12]|nr:hypothetical protein P9622_gp08 [Escherichia phage ZCEC10]UJQ87833.1 hypothetical protein [Escherichia phage ZCEC11]UJQ87928.1 hypothetical protein [Escherichia phage ZCEC12]UJQ88000.1 hypothetical protein [Escherichia phage ZCEC10]
MGAPYWKTRGGNTMLHDLIYWFGLACAVLLIGVMGR